MALDKFASAVTLLLFGLPGLAQLPNAREDNRKEWIAAFTGNQEPNFGLLETAEREYCISLTVQVRARIAAHPDSIRLNELETLISNISKGSCRLADYLLAPKSNHLLVNIKANSIAAQTLDRIVSKKPAVRTLSQADVWAHYREVRDRHADRTADMTASYERGQGYSPAQFELEYRSFGWIISKSMKAVANRTPDEKSHFFALCQSMINVTEGSDPLP